MNELMQNNKTCVFQRNNKFLPLHFADLASLFRQLWPPKHPEPNTCDYLWEALKGMALYFNSFSTAPHHTYIRIKVCAHAHTHTHMRLHVCIRTFIYMVYD